MYNSKVNVNKNNLYKDFSITHLDYWKQPRVSLHVDNVDCVFLFQKQQSSKSDREE